MISIRTRFPGLVLFCAALALAGALPAAGQVVINEYVAANIRGHQDDFGEPSDWIELYNPGPTRVSLAGWHLSDDPDDPQRWLFPDLWVEPDSQLVVYASGRDRRDVPAYWHTVVAQGATAAYRANTAPPPAGWHQPGFDVSSWPQGPTGIGYGDGDDATTVIPCPSVCVVIPFQVENLADVSHAYVHVDADDGFVLWLNGTRRLTQNLPEGDVAWDQLALAAHEAEVYQGGTPQAFPIWGGWLVAGTNVLAIEVHTAEATFEDLSCLPFVTLGLRNAPAAGAPPPPEVLYRHLPRPHTNFALSSDGESLRLSDASGAVVDELETGLAYANVSRGRYPDGGAAWHFFPTPTPGHANGDDGGAAFAEPPTFTTAGGWYPAGVTVELTAAEPGAQIRYTLDGALPDLGAPVYPGSLAISQTTVVRAVTFAPGKVPSRPASRSFIIADSSTLPTTSFIADPHDLWDPVDGLMAQGNIFADLEVPMHVEFFDADGTGRLDQDAGAKLFGNSSRLLPQKSLHLESRAAYGDAGFDQALFPTNPLGHFAELVWRNSGGDWNDTHFRDGFLHELVAPLDLETLSYRPSRVFLNGAYWGILNLREHIDGEYIRSRFGYGPGEIDLTKDFYGPYLEGDDAHFQNMWQYMADHDLGDPQHYAYVQTQMETDNFATYQIVEIFVANVDWLTNNVGYWRPRVEGGRWRWLLYDLDAGLGYDVAHNTLAWALDPTMGETGYGTYLLRHLMANDSFKTGFINRYCDLLNSLFLPSHTVPFAQGIAAVIAPEMPRHLQRWNANPNWAGRVQVVYNFLAQRPDICRQQLRQQFGLGADLRLDVAVTPARSGRVALTAVDVDSAFSGVYFAGVPITLIADPAPGFAFAGWSDPNLGAADTVVVSPAGDYAVTATFVPAQAQGDVVINEINYNPASTFDPGDWVELHNPGTAPMDLSGWVFKDEDDAHIFTLPAGTVVPARGYLVLCQSLAPFHALFPGVTNVLGSFSFGFGGGGEALRLYTPAAVLYDHVTYDDVPPWPTEPDGNGPTLELIDPALDNADGANWRGSAGHGTPGARNSVTVATPDAPALTLGLGRCQPNPFNPRTTVAFSLDRARAVDLAVYDLRGARVRRLLAETLPAGAHTVTWDGLDDGGRPLPSGTYLVHLKSGDASFNRKVVLVR